MVVAATLGAVAGAVAASRLSSEQFAWTGFFLVPLFLLLEVLLKHFMAHFGGNRDVARFTLAAAIVAATVPQEILKRYEKWKDIAAISGPVGLRQIAGFHDEALSGEWKGHRSSRLGAQFRVIYRCLPDQSIFQVMSITAHDYRRP